MTEGRDEPWVDGTVDDAYATVYEMFSSLIKTGKDTRAQLCVYVKGKCVLDLWGGQSRVTDKAYDGDSIQNVFSSGKSVAAIVVAKLVDAGHLSYDELVTKHWPEFGKHGKGHLCVSDVMRHEAGLMALPETLTLQSLQRDALKKNSVGKVIEDSPLRLPPNHSGKEPREYHVLTRGWILNEIVRRADPR